MKLEKKDRYIIANQLKILEALYPEEASSYAIHRTAFEEGYESHYNWAMESISDEPLTSDLTREVIDTLDMFSALKRSFEELENKNDINVVYLKFRGYDGNDSLEYKLMGYARYFVIELQRFQEIVEGLGERFDFNSHCEMRRIYKNMLSEWLQIPPGVKKGQKHNLSYDQIFKITNAATSPKNRGE